MAEESVNSPTTPEKVKSDAANFGINSMGNPKSSNNGGNMLPHYLRASTGSCHDFCKYGRKHEMGVKARRPIHKRITTLPHDAKNPVESVVLAETKKTVAVKLKPKLSPNSEAPLPDSPKMIKQEVTSPSKEVGVCLKEASSNDKEINLSAKLASPLKPRPVTTEPISSLNPSGGSSGRRYSDIRKGKESKSSPKHAKTLNPEPVTVKPSSSPNLSGDSSGRRYSDARKGKESKSSLKHAKTLNPKPVTAKPSSSPNLSGGSSGRRYSDARKGEESNLLPKHATSLKPKPVTARPSSSPNPSGGSSGRRNDDIKIGKKTGASKVLLKKVLAPPTASLSPKQTVSRVASLNARKYRSLKIVSPLKNLNRIRNVELKQPNNEDIQEKTLYVIKMETENKTVLSVENGSPTVQSSPSSLLSSTKFLSHSNSLSLSSHEEEYQEESEYTVSEADDSSENDETLNTNNAEAAEGECKRRPRRAGMVRYEDKDCTPVKLSFCRGKVVDLQSENNGPRRLRFRRGRVLGDNPNVKGEARRRSFKRIEVDGDADGTNPGSEKVVLRHQDVQGKKDAQGLFNNVIEETASKLVETRKSKVKALVGAFETVISLQDSKPSTNSVS